VARLTHGLFAAESTRLSWDGSSLSLVRIPRPRIRRQRQVEADCNHRREVAGRFLAFGTGLLFCAAAGCVVPHQPNPLSSGCYVAGEHYGYSSRRPLTVVASLSQHVFIRAGRSDIYLVKDQRRRRHAVDPDVCGSDYDVGTRYSRPLMARTSSPAPPGLSRGGYDACLIKTDAVGHGRLRTYGDTSDDGFRSVEQTSTALWS